MAKMGANIKGQEVNVNLANARADRNLKRIGRLQLALKKEEEKVGKHSRNYRMLERELKIRELLRDPIE